MEETNPTSIWVILAERRLDIIAATLPHFRQDMHSSPETDLGESDLQRGVGTGWEAL